ncbi:hypothetical protein Gotur_031282, partial [Gossypium turneri]
KKLLLREVFTSVQDSGSLLGYIRTYVLVRFSSPCSHREMYSPESNSKKALIHIRFLDRKLIMEKRFLDKVEDNAASDVKLLFYSNYGCFTFGKVDLVLTVEEYIALLRCSKVQIKQKGDSKCIPWNNLKDLSLAHPDTKKKVDVFTLSSYILVVFPKALGHVDEAATDLFDRLDKKVTPVPTILAETFRSLNEYRRTGEVKFIECAQLLLAWFHSHFWKVDKILYWVFSENYSPLKEIVATPRRDDIEWR